MSYRDWDLGQLREMWAQRAAIARKAKAGIDPSMMTRPRRHSFKSRWLKENADPGPFHEADTAPEEERADSSTS